MPEDKGVTVASTGKACLRSFEKVSHFTLQREFKYYNDLAPHAVSDEFGRFRVWAGNIGALQTGKSSLDNRLSAASNLRCQILQLLEDLNFTLCEILSIVSGTRPQREGSLEDYGFDEHINEEEFLDFDDGFDLLQDASKSTSENDQWQQTTELHELFLATIESITSLLKLSIVIRNPAPKDRYAKSALVTPMDPTYDIGHVWHKYPRTQNHPWLINRLGKAITRRREFFNYRDRHRQKMSRNVISISHDNVVNPVVEPQLEPAAPSVGGSHMHTHHAFLSTTAPTISFPPTQASAPQDEDVAQAEVLSDAGKSETSYATSVGEDDEYMLRPPPRPKESANGKPFECPFCFVILVARNNKSWRRHIFNDLNPFVCTFEDCDSRQYPTRHEWFEHELEVHRKDWHCRLQGCRRVFKTAGLLETHIKVHHAEAVTETQLPVLLEMWGVPVDRISPEDCPFCEKWAAHLQKIQPMIGPQLGEGALVVTPKQFRNHVAHHMEQLALFALPKHVEEDDDDEVASDKPAADDALEEDAVEKAIEEAGFSAPEGIVKLPLERGANVKSSPEDLPLYTAAKQGLEALQAAIQTGLDVSAVGKDGASAIHQAARDGDTQAASLLLQVGADLHARDSSGSTPLHRAADKGQVSLVELLLDRGLDIDSRDLSGATALRRAAGKGHDPVVQLLLVKGAEVDARDFRGSTPLHRAAENGHFKVVELLCRDGAEIDAKDNDGQTPLFHAIQRANHESVVNYLLSNGADIETKNRKGVNSLQTVSGKGHSEATRLLLMRGANADAPGPRNMRSLHRAAYNDHVTVLRILLEHGADPDLRDDDGWTALHGAASSGFTSSTLLLIEKARHTLEARDNNGMTALHHAASLGRRRTVSVLLSNGANVKAETNAGKTPLQLATNELVRKLIQEAMS